MNTHRFRIIACATAVLLFAARADLPAAELVSSLGTVDGGDWFGRDVSISGNMALVMSRHTPPPPYSDNRGIGSVFKNIRTATGTVTEHTRLAISDTSEYGGFWIDSVRLSGNMALVADYSASSRLGVAFLYRDIHSRDGTIYQSVKLLPSAGSDADGGEFGSAISLSGTVALVGAPGVQFFNDDRPGGVYVFPNLHTAHGTVTEHAILRRSDSKPRDGFGSVVHHDGSIGLVGHPGSDDGQTLPPGTAYLFHDLLIAQGPNKTETAKLFASDGVSGDYFGSAVAVSGTTGLVAAPLKGGGAVYVFRNLDGVVAGPVTENLKLEASDGGGTFGLSLSLSGRAAIVGAPYDLAYRGAAYLFRDVSTATGTINESVRVVASDLQDGDEFGYAVSLDGDHFIVGAWQKDEPEEDGWRNVGKAYTGSLSSMTIFDAGKASRNIDGLSFDSREDWIIGQTTDRNQVTLFAGDTANVTANGAAIYIGQNPGSDHNMLHIKGALFANVVHIGSVNGNANNTLRFDSVANFEAETFRLSPANTLAFQGSNTNAHAILTRLGNTHLQVLSDGSWTTVDADNFYELVTVTASFTGYTHINPKVPPPSTTDIDSDGMPDEFEQRYFGSTTGAAPGGDADGDGKTNLDEYKAGTSPVDASSVFAIQEPSRDATSFTFVFEAAPNKAYEIRSGTSLTSGYPTVEHTISATPSGGIETVTLPAAGVAKFYRVFTLP